MKVLAIVCIRNEAIHLRRCLRAYIDNGIDVALIDNGSTDGSLEIAEQFVGKGVITIEHIDWTGEFSLSTQLRVKEKIYKNSFYNWIVHADADEWLCSDKQCQTLFDGIAEADAQGYTVINFNEVVFVPLPGEDFFVEDYASHMRTYYFFQPSYPRLNRVWKRELLLDNKETGGHLLQGDGIRLFDRDFILRHYIALSEAHAVTKYVGRSFAGEDLAQGWHGNRRDITAQQLRLRPVKELRQLISPNRDDFDLSAPLTTHFWQW